MFKVEEVKSAKLEVRQEVDSAIRQQEYETLLQEMKSRRAVKVDESYFGIGSAQAYGQKN